MLSVRCVCSPANWCFLHSKGPMISLSVFFETPFHVIKCYGGTRNFPSTQFINCQITSNGFGDIPQQSQNYQINYTIWKFIYNKKKQLAISCHLQSTYITPNRFLFCRTQSSSFRKDPKRTELKTLFQIL